MGGQLKMMDPYPGVIYEEKMKTMWMYGFINEWMVLWIDE